MSKVRKVKGVSFNYLQFLWNGIGMIRKSQAEGDFPTALKLIATLIDYLPDDIKDEYRDRANMIIDSMNLIAAGKLVQVQKIPDIFQRHVFQKKLLVNYSIEALKDFVDSLSSTLDEKGYLITSKDFDEGYSHTWQEPQKRS